MIVLYGQNVIASLFIYLDDFFTMAPLYFHQHDCKYKVIRIHSVPANKLNERICLFSTIPSEWSGEKRSQGYLHTYHLACENLLQ
uniref:Uncharacterized protein n=1 Tax=Rhodnius prolixus TaxID=13249 RepID=T1HT62_RHOPR